MTGPIRTAVCSLAGCFALIVAGGCDKQHGHAHQHEPSACATRKVIAADEAGEPVRSLAEAALRTSMQPATVAAFDAFAAKLPSIVATVAGEPISRAEVRAEMMRIMPSGLPAEPAEQAALAGRAIGFLSDGVRVLSALRRQGLGVEVGRMVDDRMAHRRQAHPSQADFESALAHHWDSPISSRWRWLRRIGLRELATKRGATRVPERDVRERYDRDPTAITDGDGEPMSWAQAKPFLHEIVVRERLQEESQRVFQELLSNNPVELAAAATPLVELE